jgi:integrase
MPTRKRLARTSRILGLPITKLAIREVRGADGRPIATVEDTDHLEALLERLSTRVATGTARTYRPFITAWWSLCERRDSELDDDALLRGWLRAMTTGGSAWSASSTRVAMAAVTALRGLLDMRAPLSHHGFKSWFDGELLVHLAAPPVRKAPLLRSHLLTALKRLQQAAQQSEPAIRLPALRDQALLLLGFSAALRRSELAAVRVDDLAMTPAGGWVLRIRRSKTDKGRKGQTVPIYPAADPLLDVLSALQRWRTAAGITTGPMFRRIDRYGGVGDRPLDPSSIRFILKRLHLGDDISPHSLRRGFITEARMAGASNVQIRRVSRHKDDRMLDTYTADVDAHVQGPGAIL